MTAVGKVWESPVGAIALSRWPVREDDPLQAWDGADTYLLEALSDEPDGPVLVVDEVFGAMAAALASSGREVVAWGDSELARLALGANCERAGLAVPWGPITESPPGLAVDFAVALVRIPKDLRGFKDTLTRLAQVLPEGTPVLMGAKSKQVQKSHVNAAQASIGPASSTLARHRARLVRAVRDGSDVEPTVRSRWELESGLIVDSLPGVFGEKAVDAGTALLLEEVRTWEDARTIVDLGCGAGALGLVAAARNPDAEVIFCDSSHRAVRSAEAGWRASFGDREVWFEMADVLSGVEDDSVDVVLCNPPFHQGTEITRRVAAHMFAESSRVLRPGGRLLVVGNRHLGYHVGMGRTLRDVQTLRSNKRFAVMEGRR